MFPSQMKICTFHKERLDCHWPCRKIALKCTPNKITWHPETKLFLVLTSRLVPYRPREMEQEHQDIHAAMAYAISEQIAKEQGYEEGHEVK